MEAIKQGLSAEGGLFVPIEIPKLRTDELEPLINRTYQERAEHILSLFLTDFSGDDIRDCVYNAYRADNFSSEEIAPVVPLGGSLYCQELWHGPTAAFKDMALQILPHFMTTAIKRTGEEKQVMILTATSGDTGKAALEGFKDVPGTFVLVFYPQEGVSAMQRLQMVTQEGGNVKVCAVRGNFDDAQAGVKAIFRDTEINSELSRMGYQFSSANSINWGRLVPQIVYYFSAYLDMVKKGYLTLGDSVNVVVPTGNFGNILAAYYAKSMGLPIGKLICASNENNVLTDFIKTGVYDRNRPFHTTISPSMDILISSNLERLLFELADGDDSQIRSLMDQLAREGSYRVEASALKKLQSHFYGGYASEDETRAAIRQTFLDYGYTMDPHTAVGKKVYDDYVGETGDSSKTILVSTASPFKFPRDVLSAIKGNECILGREEADLLCDLSEISKMEVPFPLKGIKARPVLHSNLCAKEDMRLEVFSAIKDKVKDI